MFQVRSTRPRIDLYRFLQLTQGLVKAVLLAGCGPAIYMEGGDRGARFRMVWIELQGRLELLDCPFSVP